MLYSSRKKSAIGLIGENLPHNWRTWVSSTRCRDGRRERRSAVGCFLKGRRETSRVPIEQPACLRRHGRGKWKALCGIEEWKGGLLVRSIAAEKRDVQAFQEMLLNYSSLISSDRAWANCQSNVSNTLCRSKAKARSPA